MNSRTLDRYRHTLNTDVVRRMLIKYFVDKGFQESFDRLLYPGLIQDLPVQLPVLASKVEVIPHAVEVNPQESRAVLGWNLFVLGNHRMYLGETHHRDLLELARQIQSGVVTKPVNGHEVARRQATPRQVVNFLTRVLSKHDAGYVDLTPAPLPVTTSMRYNGSNSAFYHRSGFGTS